MQQLLSLLHVPFSQLERMISNFIGEMCSHHNRAVGKRSRVSSKSGEESKLSCIAESDIAIQTFYFTLNLDSSTHIKMLKHLLGLH